MPLRIKSGQTFESPCVFNMKRLLKRFILSEMSGERGLFFIIGRQLEENVAFATKQLDGRIFFYSLICDLNANIL